MKATRGTVEHEQSGRNLMEIPRAYCETNMAGSLPRDHICGMFVSLETTLFISIFISHCLLENRLHFLHPLASQLPRLQDLLHVFLQVGSTFQDDCTGFNK